MTQPLAEPRNRLVKVIDSQSVNGIDFVELKTVDATTLYVHFLNAVTVQPLSPAVVIAAITGGDRIQGIQVQPVNPAKDWSLDAAGRPLLRLRVSEPGDFSTYTLALTASTANNLAPLATLDPMYASADFSFKVLCPSDFDCAPRGAGCLPQEPPLPAIDYLAKDFQSFQLALTGFSAQRYPSWQERSEADFGVMFMEALCSVADELSYLQDRVATEATLQNATQRRSLVSMARLVDYEPKPAFSASTTVQCNVVGDTVPSGALIGATMPGGAVVPFEIGAGLADARNFAVSPKWNSGKLQPYWFDDSQQCLPRGATSMWIRGQGFDFQQHIAGDDGVALLIQTDLPGESIREVVHLTAATEMLDPIYLTGGSATPVTCIAWGAADALTRDHDLTQTHLAGNLLPATQGQRFSESFAVGSAPAGAMAMPVAIARLGPNGTEAQPNWIVRYPLSRSNPAQGTLAWLSAAIGGDSPVIADLVDPDGAKPVPELIVQRTHPEPATFQFATSLLSATATEAACTVDPAAWRVVATDDQGAPTQWEYDGDKGDTLRFGDGSFGAQPNEGDLFTVQYRIGLGSAGNVAAGAIKNVDPSATAYLSSVSNPFVVCNGADAETPQHIRRMAPQEFRAVQYRAVRPEDYEAAAERLPWVLKAGTSFRWTGSWLTVFTVADPAAGNTNGASATLAQQEGLIELLNRRRLAGYESYAPPPSLISIDLQITVCALSGWLSSDVEAGVLARLADAMQPDGNKGFFYADSFTFGTPLYRSNLEAAIQGVAGVSGVLDVEYRKRGASNIFQPLPDLLQFGAGQILRVANDPNYPERGTIRVFAEGGR
jgi:hypothetical protein